MLRKRITQDLEKCEKNVVHFPSDNKFIAGIRRSIKKIRGLLNSSGKMDDVKLRHDLRNALASALGYAELLKLKVEDNEKLHAENIYKYLRNILKEISVVQ